MNRYWVSGTGNWSDNANHWSDESGGTAGASLPTSADNVYFDANSFTATGQIVTVDATAYCLDMDWTGALYNPTLAGTAQYSIYNSLKFIFNMTRTHTGSTFFRGSGEDKTITTNGTSIHNMVIDGVGIVVTLQDALTITSGISLINGALNTNSQIVNVALSLNLSGTKIRSLILGNSIIIIGSGFALTDTTNITFDAGTSTIKMTGATKTFAGGSLTYNNVEFQGTPTTITGSNTFNQLKVDAGKVAKLTAGTTQTITTLLADGATIQSATAGSAATITTPNDDIVVRTTTIQDITATKPIYALKSSVNVSGNTNITFTDKVFRGNVGAVKCTTTGRPTTNLLIGMQYYDTTLNKPIWYKGSSVWVDATGTTV